MTHAFFSDAAEKILRELSPTEQQAVESVRRFLEEMTEVIVRHQRPD